jgi:hypothetical protein
MSAQESSGSRFQSRSQNDRCSGSPQPDWSSVATMRPESRHRYARIRPEDSPTGKKERGGRMWRPSAHWLWISLAACVAVCEAGNPIQVGALSVKGVYATKAGDPAIYCLLGSGVCRVPEDSGAADAFIAQWLSRHPRAIAIPISEEISVPLLRGTVMPREVFVWSRKIETA